MDRLKKLIQILKRGNTPDDFDYMKLKRRVFNILGDAGESQEKANELFELQDRTLESIKSLKEKRDSEKNGDLKISLGNLVNIEKE